MADQLAGLIAHLRETADFNRSWADGRRGTIVSAEYKEHRLAYAAKVDGWAEAVERLAANQSVVREFRTTNDAPDGVSESSQQAVLPSDADGGSRR